MENPSEDRLIAALHDGLFEDPPWATFLDCLREDLQANYTGILFRPGDRSPGGLVELYSGLRVPEGVKRNYEEQFYRLDPVMNASLREGQVYDVSEVLDERRPDHRLYREKILAARQIRHLKVVRISEPGGVTGWLFAASGTAPFAERAVPLLGRTAGHLRRALRNYLALEGERLRARVADSAMARLNIGWLTLDATGCVVTRSAQAEALLRQSGVLRISPERTLVAARPLVGGRLRSAIANLAEGRSPYPQAIALSDDPWLNIVLVPFSAQSLAVDRAAAMIAYLQGDIASPDGRHEQLAQLYGLLPSEARMAVAMSQGASIAEAAKQLGIQLETARSYTKRIYAKMGLRGQADLVRTILTSVLTLV